MKRHTDPQKKPKRRFKALRNMAAVSFYVGFLPLAVFLSVIPNSWFSAEGYEDLGEKVFIASQVSNRVSRSQHSRRNVIYRAVDGSGLEFKLEYVHRFDAYDAVENGDTVCRHVYDVTEKPVLLGFFLRKFEMQFVPLDRGLQDYLEGFHREVTIARWLSWIYNAGYVVYVGAGFLRRRAGKRAQASPLL